MLFISLGLLASCGSPTATETGNSDAGEPVVVLGSETALEGSWLLEQVRPDGNISYHYSELWIIDTVNHRWKQREVREYEDASEDYTEWKRGTFEFRSSDNTVFFDGELSISYEEVHEAEPEDWGTVQYGSEFFQRNLIADGSWHPDAYVRVGTGSSWGGTWEAPESDGDDGPVKTRLVIDTGDSTITATHFAVDGNGSTTDAVELLGEFSYTLNGSTAEIGAAASRARLVGSNALDLYPAVWGQMAFTKQAAPE